MCSSDLPLALEAYDNDSSDGWGDSAIRGFLVKELGGETFLAMAPDVPVNVLSSLKLAAYAYAIDEIDKDPSKLNSFVTWTQANADDPATSTNEVWDAECIPQGQGQEASATWGDALPTMMWWSHNRTLDAFYDLFTTDSINERMANKFGLKNTVVFPGCPTGGEYAPWAKNRTTMNDMSKLFESVNGGIFGEQATQAFYGNMLAMDPQTNPTAVSPYRGGAKLGPTESWSDMQRLRSMVIQEADAAGKYWLINNFWDNTRVYWKGGSGGPSWDEVGFATAEQISLPFYENNQMKMRKFFVGFFVFKLITPDECKTSTPSAKCTSIQSAENKDLQEFWGELHRLIIRMAVKSWPSTPAFPSPSVSASPSPSASPTPKPTSASPTPSRSPSPPGTR